MFVGPWVLPPVNRRQIERAVARGILRAIYRDKTLKAPVDVNVQLRLLDRSR